MGDVLISAIDQASPAIIQALKNYMKLEEGVYRLVTAEKRYNDNNYMTSQRLVLMDEQQRKLAVTLERTNKGWIAQSSVLRQTEADMVRADRTARRLAESIARQERNLTLQQLRAQRGGFPTAELTPALESRAWEENARRTARAERAALIESERQRTLMNRQAFVAPGGVNYGARPLTGAAYQMAYLQNAAIDAGKLDKALQPIGSRSQQILLNFRNLARIFQYQLAYQALNSFTNALVEGTIAARDFSKEIGLIRTISQEAQLPVERWAEGIMKISNQFGTSLQDTAKATYEAISNQVAKGEDALKFMESVGRLALTTGSSQMEAMEALSAVMNSYGATVGEAENISAKFFKVVDLGRIHLKDFATSIGTALAPAAQLGVTFDEVGAMIAQLSIKGISPQQTITEIRQLMVALIKPSKEMNKALKDMGYESAQSAIQAMGFAEFLKTLIERTDGSSEEMGKLFINIRALIPALALAQDGTSKFNDTVRQLQTSSKEYGVATTEMMENAGQRMQIVQTRVKNWFVQIGTEIVEGFGIVFGFLDTQADNAQKHLDIKMRYVNMRMEDYRKKMTEAANKEIKEARLQSAEIFKIHQQRINGLIELLKTGADDMERINEKLVSGEKERISELNSIQKKATQTITQLQNWLEERQRKNKAFFFDLDIENAKPLDKIKMLFAEIATLQRTSQEEINKGNYDQFMKNQDAIIESFKQIDKVRQENSKNLATDIEKRNELEKDYKDKFVKLQEDIFQAQQKKGGGGHRLEDLKRQMQILNRDYMKDMTELNTKIMEETKLYQTQFDLKKKINEQMLITKKLTDEAIELEKQKRAEAEKEEAKRKLILAVFVDMVKEFNKFDISKVLAMGTEKEIQKAMEARDKSYTSIKDKQQALGIDVKDSEIFATNMAKEREAIAERLAQLAQEARNRDLEASFKAVETARKASEASIKAAEDVIAKTSVTLTSDLQFIQGLMKMYQAPGGAKQPIIYQNLNDLFKIVQTIGKPSATTKELEALKQPLTDALNAFRNIPGGQIQPGSPADKVFSQLYKKLFDITAARQQLDIAEANVKAQTATNERAKVLGKTIQDVGKVTQETIPPLQQWTQAMKELQAEVQRQLEINRQNLGQDVKTIQVPNLPPLPREEFASGGSVGRDTIPALLSPGEFVMNARAARKFYGQLVAMNANVPTFANGGPVNTFGDFNITLQASGNTPVDIVNIGKGLRRAIRQGRVTL